MEDMEEFSMEEMTMENRIKVNLAKLLWSNEKRPSGRIQLGEAGLMLPSTEPDDYDENYYLSVDIDGIQYDIEVKRPELIVANDGE